MQAAKDWQCHRHLPNDGGRAWRRIRLLAHAHSVHEVPCAVPDQHGVREDGDAYLLPYGEAYGRCSQASPCILHALLLTIRVVYSANAPPPATQG